MTDIKWCIYYCLTSLIFQASAPELY